MLPDTNWTAIVRIDRNGAIAEYRVYQDVPEQIQELNGADPNWELVTANVWRSEAIRAARNYQVHRTRKF